jgi:hypothetical protein
MTISTKAKYKFIEFLRPGSYWPSPYTIEQAFGVFGWMIESGQSFQRRGQWGYHTIECLLSRPGKSSCTGLFTIDPVRSVDDLRQRFYAAFFDSYSPMAAAWRMACGIDAYKSKVIAFKYHDHGTGGNSEHGFKESLNAMLSGGGTLTTQLNQYHRDAVDILGVSLTYSSYHRGWAFSLEYGYDGSHWFYPLSKQLKGDTFYATFARAQAELGKLTAPAEA